MLAAFFQTVLGVDGAFVGIIGRSLQLSNLLLQALNLALQPVAVLSARLELLLPIVDLSTEIAVRGGTLLA